MFGAGLSHARQLLTDKHKKARFIISVRNEKLSRQLGLLFDVLFQIISDWKIRDYKLIYDMLTKGDVEVSKTYSKNQSLIWKKRKKFRILQYREVKEVILSLIE